MIDQGYNRWWERKRAQEKRSRELWAAQHKLDEEIQGWMTLKERAEEFCGPRFETNAAGEEFIQLRGKETMFTVWEFLLTYENAVEFLQKHIPNLDYDPRIVWDCPFDEDRSFSIFSKPASLT